MRLTEIVTRSAVVPSLKATERDDVISELIDALISAGAADQSVREELIERVLERERKGSTGFGQGIAVPHVKHPSVTDMAAAIGLSGSGLDFNALDKKPVYSVFLLLSPEDRPDDHLKAMEAIFTNLRKELFRRFLRQADSVEDVWQVLEDADNQQIAG